MKKLKSKLKKIGWVYATNAWIKSRREKEIYYSTIRDYAKKPTRETTKLLIKKRAGEKIKFFYLGTDELQDKSGALQALEHLGYLSYFTKKDNTYGQYTEGTIPERKSANAKRLLEIFKMLESSGNIPDILIGQTFSSYIDANVFSEIRNTYGTKIINIGMDDRHQYWKGTYGLIPHIDMALTAAPECVDWYLKEGCPAIFFPEASDTHIFHPMPELAKIHEVSFVGAKYGIREKIVLALREAGIQVTTFGGGWGTGFLPVEDVPKLFAQSKVILGIGTIGHSYDFYALKLRDFDAPISGSCYVTHNNSDLDTLYEIGKEIVTYNSVKECVEKVSDLLKNETRREEIARAGYLRATKEHTWIKRFQDLLDLIIIENEE